MVMSRSIHLSNHPISCKSKLGNVNETYIRSNDSLRQAFLEIIVAILGKHFSIFIFLAATMEAEDVVNNKKVWSLIRCL